MPMKQGATMTGTVLILGASGKIGRHATQAFEAAGWEVRAYDRAAGDMPRQAQGAEVIINGLNPPNYHDWATLIPQITADVIAAAKSSGATVIIPGNVYPYGNTPGLWTEGTPHRPVSRKGRIRETMEQTYEAAPIRTIILRAGDFISGQAGDDDLMGVVHLKGLRKGVITALGNPDVVHAYTYLPDWAECARLLAEKRDTLPGHTEINLGGTDFTIRQLAAQAEQIMGRPVKVKEFGWWQMRLLAPVWELARELLEMRYLWSVPHRLSDDRLHRMLPEFRPTPLNRMLESCIPAALHKSPPTSMGRAFVAS